MPCDHLGGPELIDMSEQHLLETGVPRDEWPGRRFRWSENLKDSMWASVIVEVERRGEQWLVTRLDRLKEPLPDGDTGFRQVH